SDPVSPFGGVLSFNRTLDGETAAEIAKTHVDVVAALAYSDEALGILRAKKNVRLMRVHSAPPGLVVKTITGGYLVQTPDTHRISRAETRVVTQRAPTEEEWAALEFGWKVCKHVKSNAMIYVRAGQTVGIGAGQTSRVDSAKVAAMRAVLPLKGSVLASDALIPFTDGLEEAARHGITAAIQPGGAVRDQEVIAAADRLGLAMVFTGVRHFRH
ncbi:MAG: bifunctional phosphoribosylaminoimidazolecarboxamide formyltransferase/IMP cyclohydrolase, partial [Bryobacteraceae bacterium]